MQSQAERPSPQGATLGSRALRLWWIFCAAGGFLLLLWAASVKVLHMLLLHANMFPLDRPFEDLNGYDLRIALLGTHLFFGSSSQLPTFAYPAPAALLYQAIFAFRNSKRAYLAMGILATALMLIPAWRVLVDAEAASLAPRRRAAAVLASLLLLGFPVLFCLERGNIEIALLPLTAWGLFCYTRDRIHTAAALFGLAAAIKPFPILLCGLFLSRRQWRALLTALVTFAAVTLISLWKAGPSLAEAAPGFLRGMLGLERSRAASGYLDNFGFDHSLYTPLKLLALALHLPVDGFLLFYYGLAAVGVPLLVWRVHRMPALNRIGCFSAFAVGLAPISYDYTLIHLYMPALLLAGALFASRQPARSARLALTTLALLLFEFLPPTLFGLAPNGFGGQLHALALLGVLGCSVAHPWEIVETRPALNGTGFSPSV